MRRWALAAKELEDSLYLPATALDAMASRFQQAMEQGLTGKGGSLKMLPSYLAGPTGKERGTFLALDFGGTNVRVALIELAGGQSRVLNRLSRPVRAADGRYDYSRQSATAEELFDFLASLIAETIGDHQGRFYLGHTFSFPARQENIGQATLIRWAKEFHTTGVEGHDVGQLLSDALARKGLKERVIPAAIINDTVGTLLTATYSDRHTRIGSIIGTGHNSCYLDRFVPAFQAPMVINMESGNFDGAPASVFDERLDGQSAQPGAQRLEKMVSGLYLGELLRLILLELIQTKGLFGGQASPVLERPYSLSAADLSDLQADGSAELSRVGDWLQARAAIEASEREERRLLQRIAAATACRSARLVAATYLAVLRHEDPALTLRHTIAIDGSLYEKMPGYAGALERALAELLAEKAGQVSVRLVKNGSEVGAAIAAAIVAAASD
ncbi:hexokinase, putative [Heliomicrobium modesticaldum Ice1]|uniref:Hexokinase, putative n=1 Tax=Heliobacterium modesticaldum (strain ATCC 51547 / Ice1) TaxID=498761 RepID=B0TB64_HELMI|nr:hexokinase [Heliomicrobium modesticaldum]ABZ83791.1 hexokinase, putative [Heliomicrobium modesticaldum Ice1]